MLRFSAAIKIRSRARTDSGRLGDRKRDHADYRNHESGTGGRCRESRESCSECEEMEELEQTASRYKGFVGNADGVRFI